MSGIFVEKYTESETWTIFAGKYVMLRTFYRVIIPPCTSLEQELSRCWNQEGVMPQSEETLHLSLGNILCSLRGGTEWLGEGSMSTLEAMTGKNTRSVLAK